MDLYETYIRTAEGDTFHPENIQEGMRQFFSDDGYRISFNIDGVVITLRKGVAVDDDMRYIDQHVGSQSIDCAVTVRGLSRASEEIES